MHIIAAKAVCLKEAMQEDFRAYQRQIVKNAAAMAQEFDRLGVRMVSGGTDNHLMLLNLTGTGVTGKALEKMLDLANITVNKNTVPFETLSPFVTSGIRVGTPAVTSRGMKEPEMVKIAGFIHRIIQEGESAIPEVKAQVLAMLDDFPLYPDQAE